MVSIGVVDDGSLYHGYHGWRWCYGVSTRSFVSVSWDRITLSRDVTLVSGLAQIHTAQPVGTLTTEDKDAVDLFGKCATSMEHKGFQVSPLTPLGL